MLHKAVKMHQGRSPREGQCVSSINGSDSVQRTQVRPCLEPDRSHRLVSLGGCFSGGALLHPISKLLGYFLFLYFSLPFQVFVGFLKFFTIDNKAYFVLYITGPTLLPYLSMN